MSDLVNKYFKVLDHGYIALKDWMGSDEDIEAATRVSYDKGTRQVNETLGLLDYISRNEHHSPIEMAELKFHIKLPLFVLNQMVRHRTANLNVMSGRYSIMPEEYYLPTELYGQSKTNKQGREGIPLENSDELLEQMKSACDASFKIYHELLDGGVCRELARTVLPQNIYTKLYWKIDLRNLFHFIKLRTHPHAQYEIRVYAEVMAAIVRELFPLLWKVFENNQLLAELYSYSDMIDIHRFLDMKSYTEYIEQNFKSTKRMELLEKINITKEKYKVAKLNSLEVLDEIN